MKALGVNECAGAASNLDRGRNRDFAIACEQGFAINSQGSIDVVVSSRASGNFVRLREYGTGQQQREQGRLDPREELRRPSKDKLRR
ncbi:MAG: hypothetical protein C5B50_18555 [Verrucomicrobia bacterium]|nr:MAG: hypothetical protein C5B50_18555 [Verrucomicrobiota bacterium]